MKREQISDALNLLDDELLSETDRMRNRSVWLRPKYYRGIGAAACLILVAAAGNAAASVAAYRSRFSI